MSNWQTKKLCDWNIAVIDGDRGMNYPSQVDLHKQGACLFLSAANVTRDGLKFHETTFISRAKDESMGKGKLHRYDIVVTTRGTVGNVAYYSATVPYDHVRINSGMALLRCNGSSYVDAMFLLNYLKSSSHLKEVERVVFGSAQPQLTIASINNFPVSAPGKAEQERIVGVLEVWDAYLEKLEQKIALKEQLKKGLLQTVLDKHWEQGAGHTMPVSETFEFLPTFSHSKAEMTYMPGSSEDVYCIHYGDIHTKYKSYIKADFNNVPHLVKCFNVPISKLLKHGDIVLADASEDYEGVGKAVEVMNIDATSKCIAGLHTFALRPMSSLVSPGFGTLIFRSPIVHKSLMRVATYSKVFGISKASLSSIRIHLPSIDEQKSIAKAWETLNNDTELLRCKSKLIIAQKKFLLNNLVTGKIRTPEDLKPLDMKGAA